MDGEEPKYCITLVHGTFAPDAPWTREGSVLRNTLQSSLDGKVLFSAPNWGGANSPGTRRSAADRLADHLINQFAAHPNAGHFIVAHSHGGNVALMSGCAAAVSARLRGLVCLATPFLSYKPRRFMPYLSLLVFSAFAFILVGLMGAISGVVPEPEHTPENLATFMERARVRADEAAHKKNSLPLMLGKSFRKAEQTMGASGAMLTLTVTCVGLPWLSVLVARRICQRIQFLQAKSAERYRIPSEVSFRTLGVYVPFDEARLWLRGLWRLAEIPFKMNAFLIGLYGLLGIFALIGTLPGGLAKLNLDRSATAWVWCLFWGILMVANLVALVSAATQALMFLCVFIRGHRLGFGWEGWTTSWLGRIIAREKPALPDAQCEMLKVNAATIADEIGGRKVLWKLRHSLLYESPTVVRGIADWMKQQTRHPSSGPDLVPILLPRAEHPKTPGCYHTRPQTPFPSKELRPSL